MEKKKGEKYEPYDLIAPKSLGPRPQFRWLLKVTGPVPWTVAYVRQLPEETVEVGLYWLSDQDDPPRITGDGGRVELLDPSGRVTDAFVLSFKEKNIEHLDLDLNYASTEPMIVRALISPCRVQKCL